MTNSFENTTNYTDFTSLDFYDLPRIYELRNVIFYFLEKCGKLALCKNVVLKNIMPDINNIIIIYYIQLVTQETAYKYGQVSSQK
jgi:hypothetical protein